MKCPKCAYLGFETGDRCRNCGYDFSLFPATNVDRMDVLRQDDSDDGDRRLTLEPDYEFRAQPDDEVSIQLNADLERDDMRPESARAGDATVAATVAAQIEEEPPLRIESLLKSESPVRIAPPGRAVPRTRTAPMVRNDPPSKGDSSLRGDPTLRMALGSPLPLFTPAGREDEPLIKVPPAPRPPLAVRRAIESPRLRAVPRPAAHPASEPALQFAEDSALAPPAVVTEAPAVPAPSTASRPRQTVATDEAVSRGGARLLATLVDHLILLGIDLGVVYFTVRMAGLSMGEWRVLPAVPLLAFLALLKVSYFYAFTAVGGQTIGKMAVGTCVIADDGGAIGAARAMRRTCAGLLSVLLLGLGYVPALFGHRLALHDRVAHTRVVRLRSV